MLIIFDLDDTLIQTSELITPWRFEKVIHYLYQKTPLKHDANSYLKDFSSTHQKFETSKKALIHFFEQERIDHKHLNDSVSILNEYDELMPVQVYHGVYELLKLLKKDHCIICVTAGDVSIQNLKLQKSQLDKNFFHEIFIASDGDKETIYKEIFEKYLPERAIVIGDRVSNDLKPAKNIGFSTVLVRQGRGKFQEIREEIVDFVIQDVTEVENLIKSLAN